MGSVQFQVAPVPAYTSGYLQAPSGVVAVTYRDFNLLHRSLLKRFPLLVWLVCWSLQRLISALTQAGGGGLLFTLLVLSRCGEGLVLLSPLRCSGSRPFYMERARGSSPRVFHKSAEQKAAPAFCAFPVGAAQAARSLLGALSPGAAHLLPSAAPAPVPARTGRVPASRHDLPGGCRPSRISGGL